MASYSDAMEAPDEMVRAADRALYEAKGAGRDMLALAPPSRNGGATPRPTPAATRRRTPAVPPINARSSLYLVDPDDGARAGMRHALAEHGHHVWDTGDAREAIRRFAAAAPPDQPDVVVVCVDMPEMSGPGMIEVLAAMAPGVRVVYIGGDGATATPNAGSVVAALRKPVRIDALLEALDGAGGR
jgi:CheY-like chemotaxis protein